MEAFIERGKEEIVVALDGLRDYPINSKEYEALVVTATNLMEQANNAARYDLEHDAAVKAAELSNEAARYRAELELEAAKAKAEADKIVGIERAKTDRMTAIVEAASDFASSVLGIGVGAAGTALGYVGLMKVLEFEQTGAVTSKTFNSCVSMLTKALKFR